jgi:sporulation protein YlmC with PRC-barrel domain
LKESARLGLNGVPQVPGDRIGDHKDFHFGAPVYCSDGRHIGSLRRIIVDRESLDAHSIVVKESRRFSGHYLAATALVEDDISIPLSQVWQATHDRVVLTISSADARHVAPYLTYQYAPLTQSDALRIAAAMMTQTPYVPNLVAEAHKRLGELEISVGENIMLSRTGKRLGTVREIIMDDGEVVGVVMRPSGVFKEDVLLQVRFLGRSDDLTLFAHLTEADLMHLKPFHPEAD